MPLILPDREEPSLLARATSGNRIRRASTIAFADGASHAAFNDDLKTLSKSLEFMIAALEGLLCEELRPAFVTCDEENLTRFGAIHRRIATLTHQLKELQSGGKDFSEVVKPKNMIAATSPTRTPPAIERAVSSRALSPSASSPTAAVFGSRDAKVGIESACDTPLKPENEGLQMVIGGNSGELMTMESGSPSLRKKRARFAKVKKAWHNLTHKNFWPPSIMPVGEKYIKEKFEEMDQDSSGELDRSEVETMLKSEGLSDREVKEIVDKFDANGDGVIQWTEFRDAIQMSDLWTRRLGRREMIFLTFDDPASSTLARIIFHVIFWSIVVAVMSMILESLSSSGINMDEVVPDKTMAYGKLISACGMDCDSKLSNCPTVDCNPSELMCQDCLNDDAYRAALDSGANSATLLHCNHCSPVPHPIFRLIEYIIVPIFTIEYVARFSTYHAVNFLEIKVGRADQAPKQTFTKAFWKTFEFFVDPLNMLDLLAILPFFIDLFTASKGGGGLKAARVVRLARIFRVFKLGKTNDGMKMFLRVMRQSFNALRIIFFFLMLSMILFGCVIFELEKGTWDASPHATELSDRCSKGCWIRGTTDRTGYEVSPYTDIPVSFWWVLVTQTTVGFGDMYPTTRMGQSIGVICMVIGILVLALPITVIGANFAREYNNRENRQHIYQDAAEEEQDDGVETQGMQKADAYHPDESDTEE